MYQRIFNIIEPYTYFLFTFLMLLYSLLPVLLFFGLIIIEILMKIFFFSIMVMKLVILISGPENSSYGARLKKCHRPCLYQMLIFLLKELFNFRVELIEIQPISFSIVVIDFLICCYTSRSSCRIYYFVCCW